MEEKKMARHSLGGRSASIGGPVVFIGLAIEGGLVLLGAVIAVIVHLLTGKWE